MNKRQEPSQQLHKSVYLIFPLLIPILFLNNRIQADVVFVVLISFIIVPKLCKPQKIFFIFCVMHYLWFCKNPLSPLNTNPFSDPIMLHALYRDSALFFGASWLLIHFKPRIYPLMHTTILFSAVWFLFWRIGIVKSSGISGSHTLDACFLAIGAGYFRRWIKVFVLLVSLSSLSTTPYLLTLLTHFRWSRRSLSLASIATLSYLAFNFQTVLNNDRVYVWRQVIRHLNITQTWLIGNGLGSFKSLGALFDAQSPFKFTAAHNEPLEFLFEFGTVGFLLFCWCSIDFYFKQTPFKQKVLQGLLLVSLLHSPFRQAFFTLFLLP